MATQCWGEPSTPRTEVPHGTPLSITKATCLECGGRRRRWRPDVRELRVAISARADDVTCRSTGEASGHAVGSVGERVGVG
eukprot:6211503-Pleurochrysis_carterae.AAC.1